MSEASSDLAPFLVMEGEEMKAYLRETLILPRKEPQSRLIWTRTSRGSSSC